MAVSQSLQATATRPSRDKPVCIALNRKYSADRSNASAAVLIEVPLPNLHTATLFGRATLALGLVDLVKRVNEISLPLHMLGTRVQGPHIHACAGQHGPLLAWQVCGILAEGARRTQIRTAERGRNRSRPMLSAAVDCELPFGLFLFSRRVLRRQVLTPASAFPAGFSTCVSSRH